jgi:taurine transport system substrate-binding protein
VALPLLVQGTLSGMADMGMTPLILAQKKKLPVSIVWFNNVVPLEIVVRTGITFPDGLRGKNIGISTGTPDHMFLVSYLKQAGMSTSDVQLIELDPAAMLAAFTTGQVDAIAWGAPVTTEAVKAGGYVARTTPATSLTVFSKRFISKNPAVVQTFVCDLARAHRRFTATPARVWTDLARELNLDASEVRTLFPVNLVPPADQVKAGKWKLGGAAMLNAFANMSSGMSDLKLFPEVTSPVTAAQARTLFDLRFVQAVGQLQKGSAGSDALTRQTCKRA